MCTRDGQVRWVRDEAVLVRGGDGRPLFWQGILTDITATQLAAARLAEALDREQDAAHQLAPRWTVNGQRPSTCARWTR